MSATSWDVVWSGHPEIVTHLDGRTRGQAKAEVLRRVRDAGYRAAFTDITARSCRGGTGLCGVRP